jgi:predicted TPR repeat methyltransferase
VALNSDDHLVPWGTRLDNTRWPRFVKACESVLDRRPLRALDLGCAGGGIVLDFLLAGHIAVGIEGSDYSQIQQRAEWRTIPHNLFTADITKPFIVGDVNDKSTLEFDVIMAWDVMEHIHEGDLEAVFANVMNHLRDDGYFVGTISLQPDENKELGATYHHTVKPRDWWIARYARAGLEILRNPPFQAEDYVRGIGNPYNHNDADYRKVPDAGFHFVARKSRRRPTRTGAR